MARVSDTDVEAPARLPLLDVGNAEELHTSSSSSSGSRVRNVVAVVGIAGLYRTGKSFLLNRLLGLQSGFEIGPSVNPCTKGIWIWGQPVKLAADYHAIFLDTEGLGSAQRTASCDMQILSLCLLLSSCFIYNSMGAIDEVAIDDLNLVLNLSRHIHAGTGAKGSPESTAELARYLPTFMWVLRDFHMKLEGSRGEAMTSKDYLEKALGDAPGEDQHNELRRNIRELFTERDCVTMIRPVTDEADLRHIERKKYEELRPQFRAQVEEFTKKVYMVIKPKQVDGGHVSGPMFVQLASEYCKAINMSRVPVIKSTWSYLIQHQLRESLKEAVIRYRDIMKDRALQCLPMRAESLREVHKGAKAEALQVLTQASLEADPAFQEYRVDFRNRIRQVFEEVSGRNNVASQRQCQDCADELYRRIIEEKLQQGLYKGPGAIMELMQDWNTLQQQFVEKTYGPAQVDVLTNDLFPRLRICVEKLTPKPPERGDRTCTFSSMLATGWK